MKAVTASERVGGAVGSASPRARSSTWTCVPPVAGVCILAGRVPLPEAAESAMAAWSLSARRFWPDEAGCGSCPNGGMGVSSGRVMGGTSSAMAARSVRNSGNSSSNIFGRTGLAMKSRACDSLTEFFAAAVNGAFFAAWEAP